MPQQLAFNVFPHIGSFTECDYTNEEWKLVHETHKIMHDSTIKISATTVRVPVRTGHSESVYIETKEPIAPEKVRQLLRKSPGVVVMDGLWLWVVADNLRKGAATNAVQIAECLIR